MDRRSFIRSMFMAAGAVATGVALMPRQAEAAGLLDTLKAMEKSPPATPPADLPAPDAQESMHRPGHRRFRRRRRVCVTRVGPRGRIRRVCRIG